jgi:hypothetical protein
MRNSPLPVVHAEGKIERGPCTRFAKIGGVVSKQRYIVDLEVSPKADATQSPLQLGDVI